MKLYTLLLLLCAALPINGAALDSLAFTPDTQSVNVGDTFTLSLDIGKLTQHLRSCGFFCFINESSLFAWQVEIDYDPNVFQALQVDEGTFLPGTDTTTWFPGFIDDTNGSISFILESLTNGSSGVNTDLTGGQLLTVTFQALAASLGSTISIAPGSCFQATIDLGTTDCTISTFLNTSATATVSVASSAVPEPSLWLVNALMLLAMGVAGLPVRRLRDRVSALVDTAMHRTAGK